MKIRLLSKRDVRAAVTMDRAIELMREAFSLLSLGAIQSPQRINLSNDQGVMLYKPSALASAGLFGLKAVSIFPRNAERGLPVTTGLMLVNDSQTGMPTALMDAEYLTALRTGAAAGLATRMLANPDTTVAALFGVGGQAPCQLQALLHVLPLETVHVFSRRPDRAELFCKEHAANVGDCRLLPALSHRVLKDCGVITLATTSKTPVFADEELSEGTHLNGVGSFTPEMAEVPPETVVRAEVFVDQREAALQEAGDLIQPRRRGLLADAFAPAELGEVILKHRPGRRTREQITFFKSVGNAAQDIVCAAEVLVCAERDGLGQMVEL